ncbi:MAG: MucB/RseB C-terminal domain-containing protein [Granulosicoccaceae bacterium]
MTLFSQIAWCGELPTAERLLEKMTTALKTLNYKGTFVHIAGDNVESMSIVHGSDDQGELEHMLSLNGEAREVIRTHSLVTCIWPNSQSVVVSQSKPRNPLPTLDAAIGSDNLYQLALVDSDRVAGIETHVLEIQPRDEYRYGYRLWVDKQSNMLLRSLLFDQNNRAIEQVMFTSIVYPQHIDGSLFQTKVSENQVSWREPKAIAPAEQPDRVQFENLPMGYREVSESYRPMPINDGPVTHVMLSDGMSSVSVYVEHVMEPDQDKSLMGHSSMGAMNAFSLSLDTGFVTAVGEVPMEAVKSIAQATRLKPQE